MAQSARLEAGWPFSVEGSVLFGVEWTVLLYNELKAGVGVGKISREEEGL